ncbi:MAG TPA: hypothetical protein VHF06_30120, partial [Pseudonocardiaceae bacterium]|nr:hypothetical protein [Pseudonocardiaceae bacterium]
MGLAPDEVLGDGRYQLLAQCGADVEAGLEFWHAWDVQHDRNIALTVLVGDRSDERAVARARHILEGVRYAETVAQPALARVLYLPGPGHVAASHDGVLGLVVAEWTDGVDLTDVVLDGPLPVVTACRVLRPLVAAVDAAHHAGVTAGVDMASRIRIGDEGTAVLAFRGTRPDATTREDARGLAFLLYLLLTGRWPDPDGLLAPADVRPDVPRDLSLIVLLSIDDTRVPDIRTCGPLLRALDEVIAYQTETTVDMPLLLTHVEPPAAIPDAPPAPEPEPVHRPKARGPRVRRGVVAGVVGTVVAIAAALVGAKVAGAFDVPRGAAAQQVSVPHFTTTTTTTTTRPPTTTTKPPPPPVAPTAVTEYLVQGTPDNPAALGRVIDGDPGTIWRTDTYRQQFPAYIPGIGIMAALPHP